MSLKYKYADFQDGGAPITRQVLNFMQDGWRDAVKMICTALSSSNCIVSGCEFATVNGEEVISDGIILYDGIPYPLVGGVFSGAATAALKSEIDGLVYEDDQDGDNQPDFKKTLVQQWFEVGASGSTFINLAQVPRLSSLRHAGFSKGMIIPWYDPNPSALPPSGWAICDGTNGTYDLRGRFLMGADDGSVFTPGSSGGNAAIQLSLQNLPNSEQTITSTAYQPGDAFDLSTYTVNVAAGNDLEFQAIGLDDPTPNQFIPRDRTTAHSHQVTVNNQGASQPFSILPPYYVIRYIMYLG